jgi:hypothetical protein
VLQSHATLGSRTPWHAAPLQESIPGEGRGGGGGEGLPRGFPTALACDGDNATAIVVATNSRTLLPANAANTGAMDIFGKQSSPPLAVALLLLRQLLLLLQLPWGIGVCIGVSPHCCCHCHGSNLAVIVAASDAIAANVGGGRTCMIAS